MPGSYSGDLAGAANRTALRYLGLLGHLSLGVVSGLHFHARGLVPDRVRLGLRNGPRQVEMNPQWLKQVLVAVQDGMPSTGGGHTSSEEDRLTPEIKGRSFLRLVHIGAVSRILHLPGLSIIGRQAYCVARIQP